MIHQEGTKGTKDTKAFALGVSQAVLGAAIEVHRELGPGLLESVYEMALCRELWIRQLRVERQVLIDVVYKGSELDARSVSMCSSNPPSSWKSKPWRSSLLSIAPNSSPTLSSPATPLASCSTSTQYSSSTACDAF